MSIEDDEHADSGTVLASVTEVRVRRVPAEPEHFPAIRKMLAAWAEYLGMASERVEGVVLASYEALANVAQHAYVGQSVGTVDVRASYRSGWSRAYVTVTDAGRWQRRTPDTNGLGGRGLVLIENLAEYSEITSDAAGTTVRMAWSVPASHTVDANGE